MSVNGDIRDQLATAIEDMTGLSTPDGKLRVSRYVPEQINTPCAILTPGAWTVHGAADGEAGREWIAQLVTGRTSSESAQVMLDDLVETSGAGSFIAAINAALDGAGYVHDVDEYVALPIGELTYVACSVRIRIYTDH